MKISGKERKMKRKKKRKPVYDKLILNEYSLHIFVFVTHTIVVLDSDDNSVMLLLLFVLV